MKIEKLNFQWRMEREVYIFVHITLLLVIIIRINVVKSFSLNKRINYSITPSDTILMSQRLVAFMNEWKVIKVSYIHDQPIQVYTINIKETTTH